ncbi:GNAT family protein [Pseudohongiella nitratireducens]|uniref:GNAT family N-acetyltransferase n=1 Tax=Pseudohongiella nitratireducens TaxID=1768907 RepID=UPI0030ECB62A|tara:strand:+ start:6408 stop:6905 length:498 start_codon:yes stop_codon:yes gene_type:complete
MITLREFRQSDTPRLVELANNPAVARRLKASFPHPYTEQDATWWINEGCKEGIHRVIEQDGLFVGTIGSVIGEGEKCRQYSTGYWLGEPYWGQGIVTRALAIFIEELFRNTEVERFQAWVYEDNIASMRVLEKAGFHKEAVLKKALYNEGKFFDEHVYALLRPHS